MTSTEGIYRDPADPKTLVEQVTAKSMEELEERCVSCRKAASGRPARGERRESQAGIRAQVRRQGTTVIIGHARHRLSDLVEGRVACTRIGLE